MKSIEGLVLNIHLKNDHDAVIKILTNDNIMYFLAKGIQKIESKNRNNIFVGSIVEIEYFPNYGKENYFLLKSSQIKYFVNFSLNNIYMNELYYIFQFVNQPSNKFLFAYTEFAKNFQDSIQKLEFILTYLLNLCLSINGKQLNYAHCAICRSNQKLYCFNFYEGGMLCQEHKMSYKSTPILLLKSFYYLGTNFEQYYLNTNSINNNFLYRSLKSFLNDY